MNKAELDLEKYVRTVPDFPTEGINFRDISPLLLNAEAFAHSVEKMASHFNSQDVDYVAGIEARGFLLASALSIELQAGLLPIRKKGKLPRPVISLDYDLEYGAATLEVQKQSIPEGAKVLIVDDVLATGGTAECASKLINLVGGRVIGFGFLISLDALNGRERISGYKEVSLLKYE